MKKVITLLLMLITFSCYSQLKIEKDKYYHFGAGVVISSSVWTIQQSCNEYTNPIFPTLVATSAGCFKETIDAMNNGRFNSKDLAFTIAGAAITNTILYFVWNKNRKHKRSKVNDPL